MVQVTEQDDGGEIELKLQEDMELDLAENPTTGFRWHVTSDGKPACDLMDNTFEAGKGVGQPGKHVWRFQAVEAGSGTISLIYRRGWEKDSTAERSFTLTVRVA